MEEKVKLIMIICNHYYSEELMALARQAGAQGGTIIGAKGTGTEEDAIFFGLRLVPEKEILMILANESVVADIVNSVRLHSSFSERGSGIIFTINVEQALFFQD